MSKASEYAARASGRPEFKQWWCGDDMAHVDHSGALIIGKGPHYLTSDQAIAFATWVLEIFGEGGDEQD